jgi:hypothetical protein
MSRLGGPSVLALYSTLMAVIFVLYPFKPREEQLDSAATIFSIRLAYRRLVDRCLYNNTYVRLFCTFRPFVKPLQQNPPHQNTHLGSLCMDEEEPPLPGGSEGEGEPGSGF